MSEPQAGLSAERLRQVLSYDVLTGRFTRSVHGRAAGKTTGTVDSHGYVLIRVDGRLYRACRLAWLYVTGEWPPFQIDHINMNRADDRWVNLRSATNSQNNMNRSAPKATITGIKGVYLNKKARKWSARITLENKYLWLGSFDSPESARAAYVAAAEKLHGQFARTHD